MSELIREIDKEQLMSEAQRCLKRKVARCKEMLGILLGKVDSLVF